MKRQHLFLLPFEFGLVFLLASSHRIWISDVVQLLSPELRKFTASVLVLLVLGEYCTVIKPTVKGYMESPSHPNCSYHSYLQAQT